MKYKTYPDQGLLRIAALRDINRYGVRAGDYGGRISSTKNLAQDEDAWVGYDAVVSSGACVFDDAYVQGRARVFGCANVYGEAVVGGAAQVYGSASVFEHALVSNDARVFDCARIYGVATIYGDAAVCGDARVYGNAQVYGNARVFGRAHVSGDAYVTERLVTVVRSDGYYVSIAPTRAGARIMAGRLYFSPDDARKHWQETRGGTLLGMESIAIVDYLETRARRLGWL